MPNYKAVRCSEGTLKLVVKESCEGTWKLSTCQPRSQCFSLLFYFLFFRDWNAVVQYHTIHCLLNFCNTYHRQASVCFTEASRLSLKQTPWSVELRYQSLNKQTFIHHLMKWRLLYVLFLNLLWGWIGENQGDVGRSLICVFGRKRNEVWNVAFFVHILILEARS